MRGLRTRCVSITDSAVELCCAVPYWPNCSKTYHPEGWWWGATCT